MAAGPQRRHRRPDRRRRPRPAGPVPRDHPAHRRGHRLLRSDPALGRDRRRSWRTRSPPRSATTSSGPISGPRRWPQEVAQHVRRGRPGRRRRCRRSTRGEMGAGFGELKSLAKLESKPIGKGHKVDHRHARLLRRRADVRHADLGGRAWACSTRCRWARVCCWAARPTRRTWRTGCCGCATRPRPTCAGSSTTCSFVVGKESRDRLKGIQRQLRDHYRGIANQTTRSLNESLQATIAARGWRRPSATPASANWSVSSTSSARSSTTRKLASVGRARPPNRPGRRVAPGGLVTGRERPGSRRRPFAGDSDVGARRACRGRGRTDPVVESRPTGGRDVEVGCRDAGPGTRSGRTTVSASGAPRLDIAPRRNQSRSPPDRQPRARWRPARYHGSSLGMAAILAALRSCRTVDSRR